MVKVLLKHKVTQNYYHKRWIQSRAYEVYSPWILATKAKDIKIKNKLTILTFIYFLLLCYDV